MNNSKIELGDEVLIDLTGDTVNENNLLFGATAHDAAGNPITGAVVTHDVVDNLTSTSTEDALSANQGRVLKGLIDQAVTQSAVTSETWTFTLNNGSTVTRNMTEWT